MPPGRRRVQPISASGDPKWDRAGYPGLYRGHMALQEQDCLLAGWPCAAHAAGGFTPGNTTACKARRRCAA